MKAIRWIVFLILPIPLAILVGAGFGMMWLPLGYVVNGLATPLIMHYLAPRDGVGATNMYMFPILVLFVIGTVMDFLDGKVPVDSLLILAGMIVGLVVVNVFRDKLVQRVTNVRQEAGDAD